MTPRTPPPSRKGSIEEAKMSTTKFDITKLNVPVFDGEGFPMWKWRIMTVLSHAKLKKVIEADAQPTEEEKDSFNLIMMQALSTRQLLHIYNLDTPHKQWSKLLELHEGQSSDQLRRLTEEFQSMKMDSGDDMSMFLAKVLDVMAKLEGAGEPVKDTMAISSILRKLPQEYEHFIVSWNQSSSKDQTFSSLQSKLIQEALRLKDKEPKSRGSVMNTHADHGSTDRRKKFSRGPKVDLPFNVQCYYCGKKGHKRNQCLNLKSDKERDCVHADRIKPNKNKSDDSQAMNIGVLSVPEANQTSSTDGLRWLGDSGATNHMCPSKDWFESLNDKQFIVKTATGDTTPALGVGTVKVWSCGKIRTIKEVLYIPTLTNALLSLSCCDARGHDVLLSKGTVKVVHSGELIAKGRRESRGLYRMDFKPVSKVCTTNAVVTAHESSIGSSKESGASVGSQEQVSHRAISSLELWHRRLAHCNLEKVKQAINWKGSIPNDFECIGCIYGKAHRRSFPKAGKTRVTKPGELVHMDIAGPMLASYGGARYFLLIKDDFSGYLFFYPMKLKSESLENFKNFLLDFRTTVGNKFQVLRLRSDNGTEFMAHEFQRFLLMERIKHETTVPHNPEQNGYIERSMRTVVEAARSMIHGTNCSRQLWAEACNTACHVLNRIPLSEDSKSPFELVTGKPPTLKYLKIFGSKAFVLKRPEERGKWDKKVRETILVGYESGTKSFRCWDSTAQKIVHSRDVKILEPNSLNESPLPEDDWFIDGQSLTQSTPSSDPEVVGTGNDDRVESASGADPGPPLIQSADTTDPSSVGTEEVSGGPSAEAQETRYPRRNLPKPNYVGQKIHYQTHPVVNSVSSIPTPQSFQEALDSPESDQWMAAMAEEANAMVRNDTWELVDRKPWMNIVKSRWVFTKKMKPDGTLDRFKARLVAKGFTQREGVDFKETFSPVVRYDTVRVLLSLSCQLDLDITQFDIKNAFLNGDLEEETFMTQPDGFKKEPGKVCRLLKSLYGLKQAPRSWYIKLKAVLSEVGLEQSMTDPCLFVSSSKNLWLACYVDDGLIFTKNVELKMKLIKVLEKHFTMTLLDGTKFVGVQIERTKDQVFIHQKKYCNDVLKRFGMENCNPISSPMDSYEKMEKASVCAHEYPYRELIGALNFLAIVSRPDISLAVSVLSQHLTKWTKDHFEAGKRVLRYLKGTDTFGILYEKHGNEIQVFSDSDFAGEKESRRSRTGCLVMINRAPVVWLSQKQVTNTISSTEAEFVAATSSSTYILWLRNILSEVGLQISGAIELKMDNQSAMKLIKNPTHHHDTKHIDIKVKFIRDHYQKGIIDVTFVPTDKQLADFLTKPMSASKFNRFIHAINMCHEC